MTRLTPAGFLYQIVLLISFQDAAWKFPGLSKQTEMKVGGGTHGSLMCYIGGKIIT